MKLLYISLVLLLIIAISAMFQYNIAIAASSSAGAVAADKKEGFAVNDPIIISDNLLNIKEADKEISTKYIIVNSKFLGRIIDNVKKTNVLNKNTIGIDEIPSNANIQLLVDPYINYYVLNNKAETSNYKEGIFVCLSNNVMRDEDCVWKLYDKVVAYLYMSDYLFLQALIKGYNLDSNNIYFKRIKLDDLKNTEKTFDYLFTYMVLGSEYMNYICNQRYYVNGMKDVDINRIKAYYPFINENYNTVKYYYSKLNETKDPNDEKKSNDLYLSTVNSLLPIMSYKIVSSVENFITRLEMPADYLEAVKESYYKTDKNTVGSGSSGSKGGGFYGCYGNSEVNNKFECDSYYKIDGTPKNYYSLWDKKCVTNEECPYYKSNSNYINNRGGCINDGFCEFPVGVKRLGFTKYTDVNLNKPLCYNCIDNEMPKKPDYVFENDFNDRVKYNLNTIISLLDYRGL
jgi:hypothetical protein